jgi:hypothetical protein
MAWRLRMQTQHRMKMKMNAKIGPTIHVKPELEP